MSALKSCSNKDCSNYGKNNLPFDAVFCPDCGRPIVCNDNDKPKKLYDLVLLSYSSKLLVVKTIKEACDLSLVEAKDIADNAPSLIISGVTKRKANILRRKIEEAGGTIEISEEGNADSLIDEYNDIDIDEEDDGNDDETICCPKCGSYDVTDDGSDYLQYECNDCGHIWGNDEEDDEEDNDEDGDKMDHYDENGNPYFSYMDIEGCGGEKLGDNHYGFRYNGIIPDFYKQLGIRWLMTKDEIITLMESLGFNFVHDITDSVRAYNDFYDFYNDRVTIVLYFFCLHNELTWFTVKISKG